MLVCRMRIKFGWKLSQQFWGTFYEKSWELIWCIWKITLLFWLGILVSLITLYCVVIGASIYGNMIVLWIIRKTKALHNVANNLLLANLAVLDIMISVVCTPVQFFAALMQRWDLPKFMCKFVPFLQEMFIYVQVMNLILIANDR